MKISSFFRCFKRTEFPSFIRTHEKADDESSLSGLTTEIVDTTSFPIEEAFTNSELVQQPNSNLFSSSELIQQPHSTISSDSEESVTSTTSEGTNNTFYTATAMISTPVIHFKRSVNGYSSPDFEPSRNCSSSSCSVCYSRLPSREF